jgi:hypothetical protein
LTGKWGGGRGGTRAAHRRAEPVKTVTYRRARCSRERRRRHGDHRRVFDVPLDLPPWPSSLIPLRNWRPATLHFFLLLLLILLLSLLLPRRLSRYPRAGPDALCAGAPGSASVTFGMRARASKIDGERLRRGGRKK